MKHKNLALTLGVIFTSTLILLFSCRKINESTTLGDGVIPPVDNIHTFDTLLDVEAYNDTFTVATDSTLYGNIYEHFVGHIENDPFFGKTDAQLYLQLKPSSFKYRFQNVKDSLHLDSVVLVLDYIDSYGDSTVSQTLNVYEVAQSADFRDDTSYRLRQTPLATAGLLGSRTLVPATLKDTARSYKDTSARQLRIRLDDAFGDRLLQYDSSAGNAYSGDSAFNTKLKGFAITASGGNALMSINLGGANTKLAIYYKDDNNDAPVNQWDTAVAYFSFAGNSNSASAQFIQRDYSGTALAASVGGTTPDDIVYIQTTPGTFARIKVPGLAAIPNCVVHKAELVMEQVYDIKDSTFPNRLLFLDAYDPTTPRFKTLPYDFQFDNTGGANLAAFGVSPVNATNSTGNNIKVWRFDISRYVQHVVNDSEPLYDLRLFAPLYTVDYYQPFPGVTGSLQPVSVNSAAAAGRVRLYGGDATRTNPQRMRLRVVYSKI